jgi:cytidyltransferase-like protein
MSRKPKKIIGIFLGRLQPQHPGHEDLIRTIFKENDEVVLCLGSAQKIGKSNPEFERNPLSKAIRLKRLKTFLTELDPGKPYRITTAVDIQPESAWPAFLKKRCHLDDDSINTVYFSDRISKDYALGLRAADLRVRFTERTYFRYNSATNTTHHISSSTEIRKIDHQAQD